MNLRERSTLSPFGERVLRSARKDRFHELRESTELIIAQGNTEKEWQDLPVGFAFSMLSLSRFWLR